MPRVRDLLYRLRPAGAPGAANPPGVPADRAREAADELAPLFTLLEPVEAECQAIVAAAQQDAEVQRAHDRELARELLASARARGPAEREAARARSRQSADEGAAAAAGRGEASAEQVRRRSEEQLPLYVDRVVARVWELVGQPATAPRGDHPSVTLPRDPGVGP